MGNSNGHYIIVIAFTGLAQLPENPVLKEYVQSGVVEASPGNSRSQEMRKFCVLCPVNISLAWN